MRKKVKVYNLYSVGDDTILLTGTIEDVRTWMKNRWTECCNIKRTFVVDILGFKIEEDYYTYLDDDTNLCVALTELDYVMLEACEVPIEDFMD